MVTEYDKIKERQSTRRFTPEVSHERQAERNRREQQARRRALLIMADRHRDEWQQVMAEQRLAVEELRGPLPGE